jgi:hypothetical protein
MGKITHLADVRRTRRASGPMAQRSAPEDRLTRARRYRLRAEELRTISEEVMLRETCLTLVSLAESYEQMARAMDRMSDETGKP